MLLDELFKLVEVCGKLRVLIFCDSMTWHGDVQLIATSLYLRVHLCQSLGCDLCLEVVFRSAVLESEETLSHRVAVADPAIVNEGYLCVAPTEKVSCNLASKGTRSKKQALGLFEYFQV